MSVLERYSGGFFYELYAKSVLEVLFSEEYGNLILSDKPDLIDTKSCFGIEITHPVDEEHEKYDSYFQDKLYNKEKEELPKKGLLRFTDSKRELIFDKETNRVDAYKKPYVPFDIDLIYTAIRKKFSKLNSGLYKYPNNISLYLNMSIYSKENISDSTVNGILDYAINLKNSSEYSFKEIYYDCLMVLYRINLDTRKVEEYDLLDLLDTIETNYNANLEKINQTKK